MAEQDSTTKTSPEKSETYFNHLSDAVGLTFGPTEAFLGLLYETATGELEQMIQVFEALLYKQKADLEKIYEAIDRSIGVVRLEGPMSGQVVEFVGRKFKDCEYFRAVVESVKPQAAAEGGAA